MEQVMMIECIFKKRQTYILPLTELMYTEDLAKEA